MEVLIVACVLVVVVVGAIVAAYLSGHSAAESTGEARLELLRRDLDVAHDAIEVLKADADKASFASAALVTAQRSLASARRVADPVQRRRLLLGADSAPPSSGPPAASGPAA